MISPVINFPTNQPGYSTNLINQTLSGTTDIVTEKMLVEIEGISSEIPYTAGSTSWAYTIALKKGSNVIKFYAVDFAGISSSATTITITLTTEDSLDLIVSPPTGITLQKTKDSITISIVKTPEETNIIGYNFYGSEEPSGGENGFTLLNSALVTEYSFYKEDTTQQSSQVTTVNDTRTTVTTEKIVKNYYYSYTHNRTTQPLGSKPLSEANHYVVTAVAFDRNNLKQMESSYSAELGAAPVVLDTSIKDLSIRTTSDVQQSYIDEIIQSNPNIDVKPGTVTRDIHINPPSDEFERVYTIIDFMHRSQSFLTLIAFDDANNDGVSDPVLTSDNKLRLKQALLITDENANSVQTLIDNAFDKLAGNVNITRKPAQKALGQALFYTRGALTKESNIRNGSIIETASDNGTTIQFKVLTNFTLTPGDNSYYNSINKRYEVLLDIEALKEGSSGNIDADKIKVTVSGVDSLFGVTNPNPTEYGQDKESNYSLAQRSLLAFISVDSGTAGGYLATTLGTSNVSRAKIVSAGDTLMMRDIDPLRMIHTFGMVDIYVHGSKKTEITEVFGFNYKKSDLNEPAYIQDAELFHFRSTNPSVTIDNPIFDVISVKNVTKDLSYDVTGFKIINDGQVIDLDETLTANMTIGLDPEDIIQITYRYRDSDPYIFKQQPVESISSVVGDISGILSTNNYYLNKLEDPLQFGNSTSSVDNLKLLYSGGSPSGELKQQSDEPHTLIAENESSLERYGIDIDSIVVTDNQNAVTYKKDIDYIVIVGTPNSYTSIKRTATSSIPSESTVFIDYLYGENITVKYYVNTLLSDVKTRVDKMRHLTADVVIKGAIKTYIDIAMNVVIEEGSDQSSIDRKIRTAVAKVISDKQIGESVYQSDIINVVEDISGVSHVVVPFTKMVKSNNSYVIMEPYIGSWDLYQVGISKSYKSKLALSWPTTENGGSKTLFRGVFENDFPLEMVSSAALVSEGKGKAYIDEDGKLFVSNKTGTIDNIKIKTTYVVQGATGSRDIDFCEIEYGAVGDLAITFTYVKKFRGF